MWSRQRSICFSLRGRHQKSLVDPYLNLPHQHLKPPAQPKSEMLVIIVGAVSITRQGCAHVARAA